VDVQGIVGRVREILPMIRARRDEIEAERRLPRDLADALRKTELHSATVPRAIGGLEAAPVDTMRIIETISEADGSTGWCAMIATTCNAVAGYLGEAGAREVFADPNVPTAGIAAPSGAAVRENGGLRVSGRWQFASGITHADWLWAGCMVMEDGRPRMTERGPEIVHVCMPVSAVDIHDTWHVSGLRGTGSCDFSARDVLVPEQHSFLLLDPRAHRREPLYQFPPLLHFVSHLATVGLGIARAALDELNTMAQTKVPTMHMSPLAERPITQAELARAETRLAAARALLYDTIAEIWEAVCAGTPISDRQNAMGRAACTHAVETAADVTRMANTHAGGSAIFVSSPLQRHMRDAEAMTHHFTVAPHTWEQAGRVLLGRQPTTPVF
jgi:alkylation response protein AidB-like acyl-CoA dehydrogenase